MRRVLLCLWIATSALHAQDVCSHPAIPVSVIHHVKDKPPTLLSNLQPQDFSLKIDGRTATIQLTVKPTFAPEMVLVLDRSGSLDRQWQATIVAAGTIASALPPASRLGLVTFADDVRLDAPVSSDRQSFLAGLRTVAASRPHGRSAVFDAVRRASQEISERGGVVFLVSDGMDNRSTETLHKLTQYLIEHHIRLFVLLWANTLARVPEESYDSEALREAVKKTGGAITLFDHTPKISAAGSPELNAAAAFQASVATEFTLLEIASPQSRPKWSSIKLSLASMKGNFDLFYPAELPPCPSPLSH